MKILKLFVLKLLNMKLIVLKLMKLLFKKLMKLVLLKLRSYGYNKFIYRFKNVATGSLFCFRNVQLNRNLSQT